ncbi:hypothetical protein PAXRUDRAFT_14523 [Paxillus rubicundulus Ve08.2h10]|uniref:Uncharacterized protein n=1 Tax=Paxillus rubicundulus Ve08.2h10 TaxID=930991 RepID=A0A0D0CQN3_9AGAM|nr:hypothetical protein PAXRUDRAFT_14523 [Paxillus rubicundulus Ve08.2h10]
MDTAIPEVNHPAPAFAKMTVHFARLKEFKYEIPNGVQVMIILAKLLQYMNVVAHLLNINSDNITIQSIERMATMRKDQDPQFSQQQQQQQQQPQKAGSSLLSNKKKKRRGKHSAEGQARQDS